jgi:hypothetical protein
MVDRDKYFALVDRIYDFMVDIRDGEGLDAADAVQALINVAVEITKDS